MYARNYLNMIEFYFHQSFFYNYLHFSCNRYNLSKSNVKLPKTMACLYNNLTIFLLRPHSLAI